MSSVMPVILKFQPIQHYVAILKAGGRRRSISEISWRRYIYNDGIEHYEIIHLSRYSLSIQVYEVSEPTNQIVKKFLVIRKNNS